MSVLVKLNALDKNSSAAFSMNIFADSVEDFFQKEKQFESEVPFSKFYFDHEVDHDGSKLAADLEDNIN
jgi:hypothetical protein